MKASELWRKTGPGFVVAATGLGAGDIIMAAVAGARYGTALIWAVVLGSLLKFCLTEGIGRWQLATGRTLLEGWIDDLPRFLSWYFMLYLLLWTFIVGAAMMSATGLVAHAIFPALSVSAWSVIQAVLAFVLVWKGGYFLLENLMKVFIALMFITILFCAFMVMPPLSEVLAGALLPTLPSDSLVYVFGVIGGVGGSVTILSYSYWMREAGWAGPEKMGTLRLDLGIAYFLTGLFAIAIMLIAAGIDIEEIGGNQIALLIAEQLQPVLGTPGKWIFLLGFWGAVLSSMIGVWHGVPYLFANFFYHLRDQKTLLEFPESISKTPAYRGYLVYLCFLPMLLLLLDSPVWVVVTYAVTGAFFMPLVAITLLYMNGVKRWLGSHANGWLTKVLLVVCLLMFSYLTVIEVQTRLLA